MVKYLLPLIAAGMISSCSKEPGEGGTSTIAGTLYGRNVHASSSTLTSDDIEPDEDVYLIYGDDKIYSDNFKTNHDGKFEFKYLRKGKYTLYAYTMDSNRTSSSDRKPLMKTIEITEKNQVVEVRNMVVLKEADDNGSSTIRGKVFAKDYNGNFTIMNGQYYSPDENVYLIFGNNSTHSLKTETDANGRFEFSGLRKGPYKILVLSDDSTMQSPSGKVNVITDINITENHSVKEVPDIKIFL